MSGTTIAGDLVAGNDIGTSSAGTLGLGDSIGVVLDDTSNDTIGGTTAASANVIGSNTAAGVSISGSSATGDLVVGNDIGTNSAGATDLGNGTGIVIVDGANSNVVGGTTANVISRNTAAGVSISGTTTTGNLVAANTIEQNAEGVIIEGASHNTIGGSTANGNLIDSNQTAGVSIGGTTIIGNLVAGNDIEQNAEGVVIESASDNTIGGSTSTGNTIERNTSVGVSISGTTTPGGSTTQGNLLAGNTIEDDGNGGVAIEGASNNTIGGTVTGQGNTIVYGTTAPGDENLFGVDVVSGSDNDIRQNLIYGNPGTGILLSGSEALSYTPSGLSYTSVSNSVSNSISNSVSNRTTIDFTIRGTPGDVYAIDFFASSGEPGGGPASSLLGSSSVTLTASLISATTTFDQTLASGQDVTATATGPDGTSEFATPVPFSSPYTVSNGNDSGIGSLRQAIDDANDGGSPTIIFTLPAPYRITPTSPLPPITNPVVIDGTSLSRYAFDSTMVQLDGGSSGGGDGLTLGPGSDFSMIEGLDIVGFLDGAGIHVESAHDTVASNVLGATMTGDDGANQIGVLVDGTTGNVIGGTLSSAANVIGFNTQAGVVISGISATGNLVAANDIGTDAAADNLGNAMGVLIDDSASGNHIGGTVSGARNVISDNGSDGILIETSNNVVEGDYLGTDPSGEKALGDEVGIAIDSASGNTIGGTITGARNVISGNTSSGISISGSTGNSVSGTTVVGNFIGTDSSGNTPVGNATGITISSSSDNMIGGTTSGDRNIISGNTAYAIHIELRDATQNLVVGNWIGIKAQGSGVVLPLMPPPPPQWMTQPPVGIFIDDVPSNTIGEIGADNVIAGFSIGIEISGSDAVSNAIQGNLIGTDPKLGVGAEQIGIGIYLDDVSRNTVGGTISGVTALGPSNAIFGYQDYGIDIYGPLATDNVIQGNQIGEAGVNHQLAGIAVEDASTNTIGGSTWAAANTISGNTDAGVYVFGQDTQP